MQLGYGIFLHFGPNTVKGVGWGEGTFPPQDFQVPRLDVRQWAEMAAEAGMKYAVLTTKHHDGFCLWPSQHTAYSVKSSPLKKDRPNAEGLLPEYHRPFLKGAAKRLGLKSE
jgi:alpha-L-fucosidase